MKKIRLTKGRYALIDDEDYEKISKHKWLYADSRVGYASRNIRIKGTTRRNVETMHRLIMGFPKELFVDHINGNTLDNRKKNLRLCTNAQNLQNRSKQINNTSGYKGVSWGKSMNKWTAEITCNGERYILGYWNNKIDAAKAYNKKAMELHGEFANLNKL